MTIRHLLAAGAAIASLAVAAVSRAGDITYPGLNAATTVQDTDLIATWRASGPLTKVQASILEAYIQGKLSPLFLAPANNLSDLSNVGTARTNLGLGSAALASTGTSGTAICQLNANCTWTGAETFQAKVTTGTPTSAGAMFNLPQGAAPTSPVNGDVWMTSSGEFERVNGATQQVAYLTSNVASATNANHASSADNATTVGGVGIGGLVQNNGTGNFYNISINGSANFANSAGSANSANSANTANFANSAGTASALSGLIGNLNGTNPSSAVIPTTGGNLIINWGQNVSLGAGGNFNFTFVTPYTNNVEVIAGGGSSNCSAQSVSNSGFTMHNNAGGAQNCYWIAIGS